MLPMLLITSVLGPANVWTLKTSDTFATITVEHDAPALISLKDSAGHEWVAEPLVESLPAGGVWKFAGASQDKTTLVLKFQSDEMVLSSCWRARPGRGPLEHWMEIHNRSDKPIAIPHVDSLSLDLPATKRANLWWIRRGGSNASTEGGTTIQPVVSELDLNLVSNPDDGASPVPWMAVQEPDHGLYVGWEFSGVGRVAATMPKNLSVRVGNMPDFRTDIAPGKTLTIPAAFVGCYVGDIDDGAYSLHRFIIERLRPKMPKGMPDPILPYNPYLDAGAEHTTEAELLRTEKFGHDLGCEAFLPDAQWFPACGDWRWDPARFPRGVTPFVEYAHKNGMWFALWCAWTNGGISSHAGALNVHKQEDWFNTSFPPDYQPGPFYGGRLCLGCADAVAWAKKLTESLVTDNKLDYLKHDCGPIVSTCAKSTHEHHYGTDASYWAASGYYDVIDTLRKNHPSLVLENCSGGGHIRDFGITQRSHYTVATDTLSNLPDRQSIWDCTYAFPPLILQCYCYDNFYGVPGDEPRPYLWRSGMMGAWQIDPTDSAKWTAEDIASTKRCVIVYKEWIRPMLQDVRVHHILPRPDGIHWDGMFYWSEPLKRGVLSIFRPASPDETQRVKLKGLDAKKSYWIWSEEGSVAPGQQTGAQLMNGLDISLASQFSSDMIFVATAKPAEFVQPGAFATHAPTTDSDPFHSRAVISWEPAPHANAYRITATAGGKKIDQEVVYAPSIRLDNLAPGAKIECRIEALGWGGEHAAAPVVFTSTALKGSEGALWLSDLDWQKSTVGSGGIVRRDVNVYGNAPTIGGKAFEKSIWTHAFNDATPADVVITVPAGFTAFRAECGVDDAAKGGSVQFEVLLDGEKAALSPVLHPGATHRFDVQLGKAKSITLRVFNGGDGYNCDHAVWGYARFVKDNDPIH